jgi:hypothetical protein
VLFLVVCLLAAGFPPFGGVAHADLPPGDTPPADLFNFTLLSTPNQPFYATPAQIQSLKTLQQIAIQNLLTDHGLPSDPTTGEQTTAQTWGRTDALAELYTLITQAIKLPATCTAGQTPGTDCRDTDQQNAVDWFTSVYHAQKVQEADDAGLEYAKWAGRDQTAYQNVLATNAALLAPNPSDQGLIKQAKTNLANFFCNGTVGQLCLGTPQNYANQVSSCPADTDSDTNASGQAQPELDTDTPCKTFTPFGSLPGAGTSKIYTAGYCVYQPPVPYQDEYSDAGRDDCIKPTFGFPPTGPTYNQFVKWGAADVDFSALNDPGVLAALHSVAIGIGLTGVAVAITAVAQTFFKSSPIGSLGFVQAFQKAVLPYASRTFQRTSANIAEGVSETAEETGQVTEAGAEAPSVGAQVAEGGAELGGVAGAAGILFMAAAVLIAVGESIAAGIIIGNSNNVPFELADLISQAPGTTYDLNTILADSTQAPNLFVTFIEATQPAPTYNTCVPVVASGILRQCLNAPPIPAADFNSQDPNHDPIFAIQQGGTGPTTYSTQLTWRDQQSDVDGDGDSGSNDTDSDASQDTGPAIIKTARVHENWFITRVTDLPGTTVQTLRLHYTDWSGNGQNAWLFNDPTNGYEFLSVPDLATSQTLTPSTCQTDGTCTLSSSIQYVGADGYHYTASLVSSAPASTITADPGYFVTEGTPLTLTANSPVQGATYSWQFWALEVCPDGATNDTQCTNNASSPYTAPVSGASASYTWNADGEFWVQLTTTLPGGASSISDIRIHVIPVTPTLTLSPVAPSTDPTCASTIPCDVHTVQVGNASTLTGVITHGAKGDNETLSVDWGDGAPGSGDYVHFSSIQPGGNAAIGRLSDSQYSFSATHKYANPGTYTATVTTYQEPYDCDTCGGVSATTKVTENVWDYPSLAWSAPQAITYGTPLSATQLDPTATYNGANVPGTFAYTDTFGTIAGRYPVSAGDVLPAGTHPLWAHFIPSDPDVFHEESLLVGPQVKLVVNPAPLTVTADNQVMTLGGTVPTFTASASGLVNNDTLSSLGVTCTATDQQGQPISASTPVGTYPITCGPSSTPGTISLGGGPLANYTPTFQPGTLTITQASQTISFGALANHTYGDPAFQVNATASSGLPVSFTVGSTDQCTIAGNTVTLTGAGSCTVTASQAGNASYSAATSVSQTFSIAKAAATITLDPSSLSATYDGKPHLATATTTPSGLSASVSYTDASNTPITSPTNAGTYGVTATITDPNYAGSTTGTLVINKASQAITVSTPAPASAVYGATFTVAATASSGLGVTYGSSGACSNSGATYTMTSGTGTCTVTIDQAGNGNYTAASEVTETVSAQTAGQTISFGALASHTYGDAPFPVSATASSGLTVSFAATGSCTIAGSTVTITGAGSCTVTASQAGNGNYSPATSVSQTFTIAQAATTTVVTSSLTSSIVGQSVTFTATVAATTGSATPVGTVTFLDGTTTLASGIPLDGTGSASFATSALTAGTHAITVSYGGNTNFTGSTSPAVSQQVRYAVKVLSTSNLMVVLQLQNYAGSNVSASTKTVTAECVVAYSATPPTICPATPVQSITKAFAFMNSYKGLGPAYAYFVNPHGLTRGQQYDLLVQTGGDPIWHAAAFTA